MKKQQEISKDKIIKEYQAEIKLKEDDYFKALTKEGEDIDKLFLNSREGWENLVNTCDNELESIESIFDSELTALREGNNKELESLHEERRTKEM